MYMYCIQNRLSGYCAWFADRCVASWHAVYQHLTFRVLCLIHRMYALLRRMHACTLHTASVDCQYSSLQATGVLTAVMDWPESSRRLLCSMHSMHALLQTAYSHCRPPTWLTASYRCTDSHVLTRAAPFCNAACVHLCKAAPQVLHMIMVTVMHI